MQFNGIDGMSAYSSAGSDDETKNQIDYLPISRNSQFKFENKQVYENIHQNSKSVDKAPIVELLRACSLCHSSIQRDQKQMDELSSKANKQRLNCKSIYKFDEAQLNFAASYKFNYVSRKGQVITISAQGKSEMHEEMAMTQIDLRGVAMTVQVVRPLGSQDGCTILFKAPMQAIRVFMKEELWSKIDNDLQQMTKQGITVLTFAKKELDPEYTADLFRVIAEV
jgi:hypothetical protein